MIIRPRCPRRSFAPPTRTCGVRPQTLKGAKERSKKERRLFRSPIRIVLSTAHGVPFSQFRRVQGICYRSGVGCLEGGTHVESASRRGLRHRRNSDADSGRPSHHHYRIHDLTPCFCIWWTARVKDTDKVRDRAARLFALALKAREDGHEEYSEQLVQLANEASAHADDMERGAVSHSANKFK